MVKRTYDVTRRREQADATRRRVLDAALKLFVRDGYAATSVAAIATEAGVTPKTVYLGFESKPGLVRAAWHSVLRGESDGVPVGEQAWFREVLAEPDPRRKLALNTRNSVMVKRRAGPLMAVLREAAAHDADVAALWERIQVEYHANQRAVVESMKDALRLSVDEAAD